MRTGRRISRAASNSWRELFIKTPKGKYDAKLSKAAANWKEPDDVIEALFALCRKPVDNEPLKIFMALSDLDRNRTQPLKPETVQRHDPRMDHLRRAVSRSSTMRPRSATRPSSPGWIPRMPSTGSRDGLFRQDVVGTMQGLTGHLADLLPPGKHPRGQGR